MAVMNNKNNIEEVAKIISDYIEDEEITITFIDQNYDYPASFDNFYITSRCTHFAEILLMNFYYNLENDVKMVVDSKGDLAEEIKAVFNRMWKNEKGNFVFDYDLCNPSLIDTAQYEFMEITGISAL